jgi:dodecin
MSGKLGRKEPQIRMSVARVTELSATSETSFDDAVKEAVARATRTLRGVEGAWRPRGRRGLTQGRPAGALAVGVGP